MKKLWERYKAHDKKVKEAQANFKVSDIKNKYVRALMWIFMLIPRWQELLRVKNRAISR